MTQVTSALALRRVPVGSIDRDIAMVPAGRVELGWRVLIEGRWFTVAGCRKDSSTVQLLIVGAALTRRRPAQRASLATLPAGFRLWARAPRDGQIETLGCRVADCPEPGRELTAAGLLCLEHLAAQYADVHDYVYEGDDDDA